MFVCKFTRNVWKFWTLWIFHGHNVWGPWGALAGVVCDGRRRRCDTAAAAAAIARHRVYGLLIEERSCKPLCCKVLLCCMEVLDGKAQLWLEKLITQLHRQGCEEDMLDLSQRNKAF